MWSNPNAGQIDLASDIEAGHGNGGKAFMVRGATTRSFMESCYEGKRTKMGFDNVRKDAKYKPGYAVLADGKLADNIDEPHPRERLDDFLAEVGLQFSDLPTKAQAVFNDRQAFTGVFLFQTAEWMTRRQSTINRLPTEISEIIASHGQTAMTVETCDVWVVVDRTLSAASPIRPIALPPYPGFESPREFQLPDIIPDPETGENVRVGGQGEQYLRLHTSAQHLQIHPDTRAKNVIRLWNDRNNVATWPLNAMGVPIASVSFIYGELRCTALTAEHSAGAERLHLADTPLARALKGWCAARVDDLASDLNKAMTAATKPKEREHARNALDRLRDLMRKFLNRDALGADDDDQQIGGDHGDASTGDKLKRKPIVYGERIDQILLELGNNEMFVASGTKIPLQYQALDVQADGSSLPVKKSGLVIKTEPEGQFELDDGGNLRAVAGGLGWVWLETPGGEVQSNRKEIWAVDASGVDVILPEQPLMQGQKVKLDITFATADGPLKDALIDAEVVPPEMGKIGRHGRFTAGMHEGECIVRIRHGRDDGQCSDVTISIGSERAPPVEGSGGKGSDIPLIMLCGDIAPGMEEFAESQRTQPPGPQYPTIIEDRALFPGIVWLNPSSKEAERVRTSVGSSTGTVGLSTKTFTHFVALKCFEILKRLHIRQQIAGQAVTEDQYMQYAAYSELECADFIDAAWELSDQILKTGTTANV